MSYVKMVDPGNAEGDVAATYSAARNPMGHVPDATRIFSARPELMQGLEGFKRQVVWGGSSLPHRLEDLIAVAVGRLNRNAYVALSHAEALRARGDLSVEEILAVTADFSHPALTELERTVLKLAEKLTQRSDGSSIADVELMRERGLDDAGILDVITAIGFWNFQTRVFSGLGVQPEPWKLAAADARLVGALAPTESAAAAVATTDDAEVSTEVGTKLLLSNDLINLWEVALRPGETQPWHWHRHPYVVVSLEEGTSRITQKADGSARVVEEQRGHVVFRAGSPTDVHNLTNVGDRPTVTRLIEIKCAPDGDWAPAYLAPEPPFEDAPTSTPPAPSSGRSREVLINALEDEGFQSVNKVPGELSKLLWSKAAARGAAVQDDASMHMVRFTKGSGIPSIHAHASNQFMYCVSGRYEYKSSGLVLEPGDFYFNPAGSEHGPTEALEDTVLLEIYDGPHYVVKPEFEYQDGEQTNE